MSFSYRDKPRLSERLRGKSGDEILNEMKEQLDQDRKMFFETNPSWTSTPMTGPFSRAGFPFDDDMMSRRHDIRSHLDDLAQRHPEFADHLRGPPWGGETSGAGARAFGRKRRGSGSGEDDTASQASGASGSSMDGTTQNAEERGRPRPGGLNQHGLRNTVDIGQQQQQQQQQDSEEKQGQGRGQRSMSAPPDNRAQQPPQRFVSRVEINPVNPADPSSVGRGPSTVTSDGKPPMPPKQPQHQQTPPKQTQSGNVRHIPIFVEGRDEPLLPKVGSENVEQVFTSRIPQPGAEQAFHQPQNTFTRPPFPSQQQTRNFQSHQAAPPSPKQQRQAKPQAQAPPQSQPSSPQPPKQPEAPPANDPISRVQAVAKDVADLQLKVDKFTGTSRKDKDYMYLDEMLTRNLLKLDNIDTEGKENVRQARKEVIRNITRCISVLEGKAPTEEIKPPCEVMDTMETKPDCNNAEMEVVADTKEAPEAGVEPKSESQDTKAADGSAVSEVLPMEVEAEKPPEQVESEKSATGEVKTDSNDKTVADKQETDSGSVKETKPSS
ncbi:hypothetical protein C0J52_11610 [Blattella germanica]|nr:hypothetical protein C0J52_11610 [Blattella germanica]